MKQKHLASLLQENMTTVRVVFSDDSLFQQTPKQEPSTSGRLHLKAPWEGWSPKASGAHIDIYGDVQEGNLRPEAFINQNQHKQKAGPKSYVCKVLREDGYKPGDVAVVNSPRGLTLVMVVQVDEHPQIDVDADFDYKWLVQRVDMTRYNRQLEAEKNFQAVLLEIERRKHTNRIKSELLEMYGDTEEGKLLLEASIKELSGVRDDN